MLSASSSDSKIAWHKNVGPGNGFNGGRFGPQQIITTNAVFAFSVYATDLDGDGDADVLSASQFDHKIAWYENLGGGNFGTQQVITTNADYVTTVYATDLDGDGDADVLSASPSDNKIAWYENTGGGTFGPQQVITTSAIGAESVYATDLDGDGDADVLSASWNDDKIAWYKNLGGGNFGTQQVITTSANGARSVYATDLDGDGDADVLSASKLDDKIAWYENMGGGTFGAQQVITTSADWAKSVYAVDLDGDGDADVLSGSWNDDKIAWHENLMPPPVVSFTGTPTTGTAPLTVSFTDQSTSSGITGRIWYFGDGNTSTVQHPTHTYTTPGTYTVQMRLYNAGGNSIAALFDYITVNPPVPAPVVSFTGTPTNGSVPLTVSFTDQSTNSPTSRLWDFGDGNTSSDQHPTHTYTTLGTYTVTLTATNAGGSNTASLPNYITVNPPAPVVSFTGTPTTGFGPLTVSFTDQSTNSPTSWAWDFGDGNTSTDQHPTHTYTTHGTYNVTLTATNVTGSGSASLPNYITVNQLVPVASFTATPTTGTAPLTVSFTDQSTNSPTYWHWTTGDGNVSFAQHPTLTYTTHGTFTVTLIAGNAAGQTTTTITDYITVLPPAPVVSFTGTPTTGIFPLAVSFTDQSTNRPTSWAWDFGDGGTSTDQHPTHTYTTPGTYNVTLTATNVTGFGGGFMPSYITVNPPAPVVSFTGEPVTGTGVTWPEISGPFPLLISFTDSSTNSPTSWAWDFGDGNTSTDQHPMHTYTTHGIYTVTLTATNVSGSTTGAMSDYITVSLFGSQEVITTNADYATTVYATDLDGDGDADVLSASSSYTASSSYNKIAWYENQGGGTFGPEQVITTSANGAAKRLRHRPGR